MSDLNSLHNRAVWFDIPVVNLERAATFYKAVMGVPIETIEMPGMRFCVIDHGEGNGGCLVEEPASVSRGGILVYLNATGRIRDAVAQAVKHGGQVLEEVRSIGPHGFRALVVDSEGNRIALHAQSDG